MFSCEFCEISNDTFQDTSGRLLLSLLARAPFIYRLHDYFQLAYMRCKFQLNLFKPCWNFSLVSCHETLAYTRNFNFTKFLLIMRDEILSPVQIPTRAENPYIFSPLIKSFCLVKIEILIFTSSKFYYSLISQEKLKKCTWHCFFFKKNGWNFQILEIKTEQFSRITNSFCTCLVTFLFILIILLV